MYPDLDVSIYSNMYLHNVFDAIAPSLVKISTSFAAFNDPKNGGELFWFVQFILIILIFPL